MTVTRDYSEDKTNGVRRTSAYYLSNGTTLCHIFWATLWLPLLAVAAATLVLVLLVVIHVGMAHSAIDNKQVVCGSAVCRWMTYADKYGIIAYFMPEGFVLCIVAGVALVFSLIFGADKSGFFKYLWQYLKGIKSRICPLVRFGSALEPAE